jgi:hypothetical protein
MGYRTLIFATTFESWLAVVDLWVMHWTGRHLADLPAWPWAAAYRLKWSSNYTATLFCAWLRETQALSLPARTVEWGSALAEAAR